MTIFATWADAFVNRLKPFAHSLIEGKGHASTARGRD